MKLFEQFLFPVLLSPKIKTAASHGWNPSSLF